MKVKRAKRPYRSMAYLSNATSIIFGFAAITAFSGSTIEKKTSPKGSPMEFTDVIAKRYSCKKFSDKKVPAETLEKILEAGRLAPTAKNLQPQHIYVIESAEGLTKMDELTPCRYGAQTVLMVAFDAKNVFTYPWWKTRLGNRRRQHRCHTFDACRRQRGRRQLLDQLLRPRRSGKRIQLARKRGSADVLGFGLRCRRRWPAFQPRLP